jgi:aspartyl-tRNA synthetase
MGQNLAFLALRDSIGTTQVKVEVALTDEKGMQVLELLKTTPLESIVYLKGLVKARPAEMVNRDMSTGMIEVEGSEVEVLNRAEALPIPYHRSSIDVANEDIRLKYRYLELRQPYLQRNIRLRSKAMQAVRSFLVGQGFCEIETPTLFRKTSEGAREYVVPTRQPNKFYTLTQSPQQYKQLLMASGFDRYFQVARCYRDEDLRADRQPEFTQIDMELAFIQQEDIMKTIEGLLAHIFKQTLDVDIPTPFPRHSYRWCMKNYGSDKPDTRFDMKLVEVSDIFKSTNVGVLQSALTQENGSVKALNMKGIGKLNDKDIDAIQMEAKKSSSGVITLSVTEDGKVKSSIAKHLHESEIDELKERLDLQPGDLMILAAGKEDDTCTTLGRLRLWARDRMLSTGSLVIPPNRFDLFWVVDFPLFTWEDGKMLSTHHPFTAPVSDDANMLSSNPELVRGQHYDVVLNGYEIGGGSIRIHKKEEQIKVLRDILGMRPEKVAEFQHLLDALGHGCPPHGGIALGFDRLMAVLVGAKSLREVIAFPKSSSGAELMTGAPAPLGNNELDDLFDIVKAAKSIIEKSESKL